MEESESEGFDMLFTQHILDPRALRAVRKLCALEGNSSKYIDSVSESDLKLFIHDVFETVLAGFDAEQTPKLLSEEEKRFRKLALQCLVNATNRSQRLRECFDSSAVRFIRAMLRVGEFRTETLACLVSIARPLRSKSLLTSEYYQLLNDVTLLWNHASTSTVQRSWICALVSIHVEEDFAFVADCFADMEPIAFNELLRVTETLLDHAETGKFVQVHMNNIRFCMNLLERIELEVGEGRDAEEGLDLVDRLCTLTSILASAALRKPDLDTLLHDETTATVLITRILEAVIDNETVQENAVVLIPKAHDRPLPQKRVRRPASQLPFVSNLSAMLRHCDVSEDHVAQLKCACVRALGNLCCESAYNQKAIGELDGVILLLHCAKRIDSDSPFLMQWAISALRHVCMGCPENQQRLAQVEQSPTAVVDRDRLLEQMGLKVVLDKDTSKLHLERIPR